MFSSSGRDTSSWVHTEGHRRLEVNPHKSPAFFRCPGPKGLPGWLSPPL